MNDILAEAGVKISEIISRLVIRDWHRNDDVQKQMENEIEDYLLFDKNLGGAITTEQIDTSGILHDLIHVAKNHYN